jgi:acyl transferase domain-containing protein
MRPRTDTFEGEGCGVVVLKRLRDAVADGDTVLAVIRGSAVNQDGRSAGLTAPNGPAQEAVLRQALNSASVNPSDVGYVEAHGTGTPLGDPIEVHALAAVLGQGRQANRPFALASVKTNIGHLESAAGIAGLIKVVVALENEEIPAHLHFKEPNPYIEWAGLPVVIPTTPMAWPRSNEPRIAGVSSFGFSGTNAHVVIEEAPATVSVEKALERPAQLLVLSARNEAALKELAAGFRAHLASQSDARLAEICFTANDGRSHFEHRVAVVAANVADAQEKLARFAEGKDAADVFCGRIEYGAAGKIAFLFTGQGAQYAGMGRQLFETQPVFRRTLEQCDEILRPYLPRPLLSVLYPSRVRRTSIPC